MQRSVWNDFVSWKTRRLNNSAKYLLTASMSTNFKDEMKSVGELSQVCSKIVLKCLHLARIGRPDILWSLNKLVRSIKKSTEACDKRLNRLISYIHHTCEYKQYIVMWVILQYNADWECFRTPISREILKIQNPLLVDNCAFLEGTHLFQSV